MSEDSTYCELLTQLARQSTNKSIERNKRPPKCVDT